jgi:hypothetical protein
VAAEGDSNVLLADLPPSSEQTRLACTIAIILTIVFAIAALFKDIQLARADAFVPIIRTAIFFNDLITVVLLYSQFTIVGRLAPPGP